MEVTYSISEDEARNIVKELKIYHPYGTVGDLPWQDGNHFDITFGKEIDGVQLLKQTKKIKTYSEQTEEQETLNEIRAEIQNANTLVFLGMAYHKQNLDLLMPEGETNIRRVYGTSMGISDSGTAILKKELRQFLDKVGKEMEHTYLKHLTCSAFFDEFHRSISK